MRIARADIHGFVAYLRFVALGMVLSITSSTTSACVNQPESPNVDQVFDLVDEENEIKLTAMITGDAAAGTRTIQIQGTVPAGTTTVRVSVKDSTTTTVPMTPVTGDDGVTRVNSGRLAPPTEPVKSASGSVTTAVGTKDLDLKVTKR